MRSYIFDNVPLGGFIFGLGALRRYGRRNASVRIQAIDMIYALVAFTLNENKLPRPMRDTISKPSIKSKVLTNAELVHQLILHGAVTTLPLILSQVSSENEIGKLFACLNVVIKAAPVELVRKVGIAENRICINVAVRALHFAYPTCVDAALILFG